MPQDFPRLIIAPEQRRDPVVVVLTPDQVHYLYRVLRLKVGDRAILLNGQGQGWIATLAGNQAQLAQEIALPTELAIALTLVIALPKGNGFEDIIRAGTELGVTRFCPVISERTISKPSPHKRDRWQKIALEAAEQSERAIVPQIEEIQSFRDYLNRDFGSPKNAFYLCAARQNGPHLWQYLSHHQAAHLRIATGPEGGWTPTEIQEAQAQGAIAVSLGSRILRAVTAPIVVASLVSSWLEGQD